MSLNRKANGVVEKMFQFAINTGYAWIWLSVFAAVFLVVGWNLSSIAASITDYIAK